MSYPRLVPVSLGVIFLILVFLPAADCRGQGNATTVQLPTFGIAIDAEGVVTHRAVIDQGGRLRAQAAAAARAALPGPVQRSSPRRVISLRGLEAAISDKLEAGEPIDDTLRHLAGLTRLEMLVLDRDRGDILLAGPAEGWMIDPAGRAIGLESGRPMLHLDDLLTALRAFAPGAPAAPFIGCTIDPSAEGLERLREFQKTVPRTIRNDQRDAAAVWMASGCREALGNSQVRVFGIPADSHMAQVLIEADYRMKLIGIGLEPPPVKMATFLGTLRSPQEATLQRWWFTPNYQCLRVTEDRAALELVGRGVQLQGEDKQIAGDGSLVDAGGKQGQASLLFTTAFTEKYEEIAEAAPVYTQLRGVVDWLVAAAFLRRENWTGLADLRLELLLDSRRLPLAELPTPKQAPCAVNALWKGSRLMAPAGGGVSISPEQALAAENLLSDESGSLAAASKTLRERAEEAWWWDVR